MVIAEIQLTDSLRFGLEWLLKTGRGDLFSLDFGNGTFSDTSLPDTLPNRPTGLAGVVSGSRGDDLYTYVFSTLASETN
ncbi:MAG: hypothetical protein GWN86_18820, partial [Desulfobacterales bacterium]|nr:hypothetical protein [Desulfobacterales bacterium]